MKWLAGLLGVLKVFFEFLDWRARRNAKKKDKQIAEAIGTNDTAAVSLALDELRINAGNQIHSRKQQGVHNSGERDNFLSES